jgi:uncharacterized membrane protein
MPEAKNEATSRDIELNKNAAALSYLWILFLIPLLSKKDSKFCQFHAKQGLVLFILSFFVWFPFFGQILFLVLAVISIFAILKVLNGEWYKVPYIYDWSKKFNL